MRITEIGKLSVMQFTWDVLDSNSFALEGEKSILIIDPVDSEDLYAYAAQKQEALILLTHAHFDHICGLNRLRSIIPRTTVATSLSCSSNIQDPKKNLSSIANPLMAFHEHRDEIRDEIEPFACQPADITFEGELQMDWNGMKLKMAEFFGHSKDSSCFLLDGKFLFSGDTILPIPTVTRLPGGDTKTFWHEDIPRLQEMQITVNMVFPGHGMPGRLEEMIAVNERPQRLGIK